MTASDAQFEWVRCFYDAYNRRDWEWIGAMLSKDVHWFSGARGEYVRGVDAVVSLFRSTLEGFPDAQIEVRALHQAGDFVICECGLRIGNARRSDTNSRQGTFCEVMNLRGGRCVQGSTYADSLRLLMELNCTERAA